MVGYVAAGTLGDPYIRQVPLPKIPTYRDRQERVPAIMTPNRKAIMSPAKRALPTKYPTDNFPAILAREPERKHRAATILN